MIDKVNRIGKVHSDDPGVTVLLSKWRAGDQEALEALMRVAYPELRHIAHSYLRRERAAHTLQTTALVHEAYLRLLGSDSPNWKDRVHFFGVLARLMRQILVDYARGHGASKRGDGVKRVALEDVSSLPKKSEVDVLRLDDALNDLAVLDQRQCQIVELRFFTGLSIDETAEVLGVSAATVEREWASARAWLFHEIGMRRMP
jgi:RNA polymerase sigma factor (TIGR02999 family)